MERRVTLLALLLPAVTLLTIFRVIPTAEAIYLSFTQWNGVGDPRWIGTANFGFLLHDTSFLTALKNNGLILLSLPIWVLLPLAIASLIHSGVPGARFFRVAIFVPAVLSPVVIGAYYNIALRYNGPVNVFLRKIGLGGVAREWLFDSRTALPTVAAILIWATLGIGVLIYLAALAQVDQDLYDAARVDGSSRLRTFWDVTVPQVRPTIEYWSILVTTAVFTALFPFIYTLTRGGPGERTYVVEYYVYDKAFFDQAFGYASAVGVVLLAIGLVLAFGQIRLLRGNED